MTLRLFAFVLIYQLTFAQQTIIGTVYVERIPLEGAAVIIKGTKQGAITDASGIFSLTLPKIKNPVVMISYLGYKTFTRKIKKIDKYLGDIHLSKNDQLEEVVVSGTLKPISKLKSAVPVEVYSKSFFQSNPTPSLFEALEIVNGISPQLNCNICNTGDIHINGQEGSYTMILIDGLPIVSGLATVYGLFGIPQSLIERVEIVKGPASTLYGSEAIGGIINIITKIPENTAKLSFDSFVSDWGESTTDLGYKYSLGKEAKGLLGINYFKYANPIDNNEDGFTDLTLQDRLSIFNKIDFGKHFSLASRFVYEDRWGGEMNWNKSFRGGNELYGESIYTNRVELFGKYTINDFTSFQFSFNDHNQNSFYGTTYFKADQTIGFGQFIWNKKIIKHDLLFGAAFRYSYYDDNTTATFNDILGINQVEITSLPGVFIQDEIKLSQQQTLLAGLRFDYNSLHGSILTPRLSYKISSKELSSTFRLSMGSGYRVAQVFTEDHAALTGAREVVFVNDLNPEKSWNANLNYVYKLYHRQGHILEFDASLFRTDFSNKIIPNYDSNPNQIIYDNLEGKATNQGASLNLNSVFLSGFRINLGLTYIDAFIQSEENKTLPYLTERFQGVWKVEQNFKEANLRVDFTGILTGPLKLPLLGELDPRDQFSPVFSIINLQLTKVWKNSYQLYGGIKNLLDFKPASNSIARAFDPFDKGVNFDSNGIVQPSVENPYALSFDPSYVYASNQGINLFLGFRFNLNLSPL